MAADRPAVQVLREAHAKSMEALAADVHPYSASAIRDWEAMFDDALARVERLQETAAEIRALATATELGWRDNAPRDVIRALTRIREVSDAALRAVQGGGDE